MYIPFNLSGLPVFCFRSPGANQRLPTHFENSAIPFLRSKAKGKRYFGLMMLEVLPSFTTNAVSQNGQLSEATFGFKVDEAPQLVHFTVVSVCLSASATLFSFRNFSKSISSTVVVAAVDSISLLHPQYSHFR